MVMAAAKMLAKIGAVNRDFHYAFTPET